jgi:hypothetical protein
LEALVSSSWLRIVRPLLSHDGAPHEPKLVAV